jgi:O-antigen/teichoic acid export membrane protein
VAEPMILTLIGDKWQPSILYLQLLCFVGAMYPLHAINLSMLQVQGRSDLFLKLEIIKKLIAIPIIVIGIIWGIKVMIMGMWVNTLIAYYLNSYYSGRNINYPMREQVADILPSFLLALFMGGMVFLAGSFMPWGNLTKLIVQILLGGVIFFGLSELFKPQSYVYLKRIAKDKITSNHAREK